jgi:hypothetical protein
MYMKRIISLCSVFSMSVLFCLSIALAQDDIEVKDIEVGSGRPYQVGEGGLNINTIYYTDRDYIVTAMPEELVGATWIMTANDDKSSAGADFLKFAVSGPVVVWLAHDSRGEEEKGGTPPEWLSEDTGWEKHPDMLIEVTDGNMGNFILWSKEFEKGEVVLGGNTDPPASGQGSNYLVLLTPGEAKAVKPLDKLNTTWAELKK